MSYRLHDEIENGDADGELPGRSRHGAHSSDRIDAESAVHRYTYERPAGSSGRSRHAAPGDDDGYSPSAPVDYSAAGGYAQRDYTAAREFSWREPAAPAWDAAKSGDADSYACETGSHSYHPGSPDAEAPAGYGGANYGADGYGGSNYDAAGYGGLNYEGRTDADAPPPPRWTARGDSAYGDSPYRDASYPDSSYRDTTYGDTGYGDARYRSGSGLDPDRRETVRGGERSAWDEQALSAAAGASYGTATDETAPLSAIRAGTLTATRPLRTAAAPTRRGIGDAETEVVGAEPIKAPADIEVPTTPPSAARRLLFGRSHVAIRVAAVAVLVLGSAVGIAFGVLRDSDPDTVKVSEQQVQADVIKSSVPTPDTDSDQSQAAPVGAELMIKQRQQEALAAAKARAATKAAAARAAAAAAAKRAKAQRASRSESRSSDDSDSGNGTGTTGDPVPSAPVSCSSYSGNRATGCTLLAEFGFASSQMSCLDKLWTRESQWTTTAENSSSGAYGIPQSLPGNKMASVADDWRTNPATQIRWGLGYIKGRYGNPCGAWAHSEAEGNY